MDCSPVTFSIMNHSQEAAGWGRGLGLSSEPSSQVPALLPDSAGLRLGSPGHDPALQKRSGPWWLWGHLTGAQM